MTAPSADSLRIVEWAALGQVVLTLAYFATGLLWLHSAIAGADPFQPTDPFLTVLEILIILSALGFIFIVAVALVVAHERGRPYGVAALGFSIVFAALTCSAHFAQLTVISRSPAPIVTWPSVPMALDLLAWDLFFGLALVCLALAVWDQPVWPRLSFLAGGVFCLAGLAGPASGHLKLHLLATVGYAILFPAACVLLWMDTRSQRVRASRLTTRCTGRPPL